MRAVMMLAVLVFVLGGCGSRDLNEKPSSSRNAPSESVMSSVDPFVEGSSYRFVMKVKATPGLENSAALVEIAINDLPQSKTKTDKASSESETSDGDVPEDKTKNTDESSNNNGSGNNSSDSGNNTNARRIIVPPEDKTRALAANAQVWVSWECGDQHNGSEKAEMRRLDEKLTVKLAKLPALQSINDSIACKVSASLDSTTAADERVIATGSHEFYIEMDVLYPALRLHDLTTAEDSDDANATALELKVELMRQGKAVVKGDDLFDKEVEVLIRWSCNDASSSKSRLATEIDIGKGAAEATAELTIPNRPALGKGGYACMIEASAEIDGYDNDIVGSKKLWIEGKDLQVAVTAVSSDSLSYAVTARHQQLEGNVRLSLQGDSQCSDAFSGSEDEGSNDPITINASSSGRVNLERVSSAQTCKLVAEVVDASGAVLRRGESREFDIPAREA